MNCDFEPRRSGFFRVLALICCVVGVAVLLGKAACSTWHREMVHQQLPPALKQAGFPQRAEYVAGFVDDSGFAQFDSISERYGREVAAEVGLRELRGNEVGRLADSYEARRWPNWFPGNFDVVLIFTNVTYWEDDRRVPAKGNNLYWLLYDKQIRTLFYHWVSL